jgi:hypothetical protein
MKDKLIHALTQYDIKQSTRRGYNHYALAQYFAAVDEAMELVAAGKPVDVALRAVFSDRVLDVCLKAVTHV